MKKETITSLKQQLKKMKAERDHWKDLYDIQTKVSATMIQAAKAMTFVQAVRHAKAGKKIRCMAWHPDDVLYMHESGEFLYTTGKRYVADMKNLMTNNWIVVDD